MERHFMRGPHIFIVKKNYDLEKIFFFKENQSQIYRFLGISVGNEKVGLLSLNTVEHRVSQGYTEEKMVF